MATFRDWPRTLRPAHYGGAGFFVDQDTIETGRRLEVHEFPHADAPYVEDLGRKANTISVTAYVLSDSADSEAARLMRVCGAGGAKLLSLPLERLQAHCESASRNFTKDRLGYIAFDMKLVRDGLAAGPFPVGFLSSVTGSLARAFKAPASAYFARNFLGLGVAGFVRDAAAAEVQAFAALTDTALRTRPVRPAAVPALLAAVQELYDTAASLTASGATGEAYGATSFVTTAQGVSTDPLAAAVFDLVHGLGDATTSETGATLAPLIAYNADLVPGGPTPSRAAERANTIALSGLVRMAALTALAARVAATRYSDRRQVIQARADVAELFDAELGRLDTARDHDVYVALSEIAGRTAEYLTRLFADLAPVVIVESLRTMPSLWWAQRLYGDAARAEELQTRNGVKLAGFMPLSFEALAR